MPKTSFIDNISKVPAAWLNLVFNHNHKGLDQDGSNPKITQEELSTPLSDIINKITSVFPVIDRIAYQSRTRVNVFGGNGTGNDFVASAVNNTLNDGVYNFRNFTIGSTFNVTASGGLVRIKCTGDVNIQGTLTGATSTHNRIASGYYTTADPAYNLSASLRGSSGAPGRNITDTTGMNTVLSQGGKPATSIIIEALGTITIGSTGRIDCNGEKAPNNQVLSGSHTCVGGGGGTGGAIILESFNSIIQQGQLNAKGGDGGDAIGINASAGSGASGGFIVLQAPLLNLNLGQVSVSGGAAGISTGTTHPGSPGGSYAGKGGQNSGGNANAGENGKVIQLQSDNFHHY